jgi:TonB family protein
MKRLACTAAILVACACPLIAIDHSAMQELLDSAHKPADLFQGDGSPFDLEIDFIAQFKGPVPGHLSLKWQSKDHWWSKVDFGGFEQTMIHKGEMVYTSRNFNYTPQEVFNLFSLLHFGNGPEKLYVQKQRDRTENGVSLACIQTEQFEYAWDTHELCIDAASHDLLRDEWEDPPVTNKIVKRKQQFADYIDLDGKRYPKKLQLFEGGAEIVSANVSSLQAAALDPALLDPPKGAIERRMCPGIKPPKAIQEFHPDLGGAGKSMGEVSMSLTVLTDGSVGDIRLIHSGGQKVDKIAMDAMKKWKYKPAMCGADPVVSDLEVGLTFKMN